MDLSLYKHQKFESQYSHLSIRKEKKITSPNDKIQLDDNLTKHPRRNLDAACTVTTVLFLPTSACV
jgi:hypothetical protein